jgi:hypothetical protein
LGLLTASQSQRRHSQISTLLVELEQYEYDINKLMQTGDAKGAKELAEQWIDLGENLREVETGVMLFGQLSGIAPITTMMLGVISFVVALCCFVRETQPRPVWVASISLAGSAGFILSLDYTLARA